MHFGKTYQKMKWIFKFWFKIRISGKILLIKTVNCDFLVDFTMKKWYFILCMFRNQSLEKVTFSPNILSIFQFHRRKNYIYLHFDSFLCVLFTSLTYLACLDSSWPFLNDPYLILPFLTNSDHFRPLYTTFYNPWPFLIVSDRSCRP